MSNVESITPEEWPLDPRIIPDYRELYRACRRLSLHPDGSVRFPLNGMESPKAAKKAHWYFKNFCGGHFKIKTATEDGFMYLRRRA